MDLGLCDCSPGMLRGPCKHNQIVATHFTLISSDLIPEQDPRVRAFHRYLATGKLILHQPGKGGIKCDNNFNPKSFKTT